MENLIYYFSGTGNSFQVARDLKTNLGDAQIKQITEYNGEKISGSTLGIIFPVYMWGAPIIVRNFIKNMNISNDIYIYAVCTYGGLPGKALDHVQEELEKRGLRLSSGFTVCMPGNCIIQYGAYPEFYQRFLFKNEHRKIKKIISVIKERKEKKLEHSLILIDRIFNDKMYKNIYSLKDNDINFYTTEKCIACGKCIENCKVNNIVMNNKKPQWKHNCTGCMACIQKCPQKAIEYGNKTQNRKRYINPYILDELKR